MHFLEKVHGVLVMTLLEMLSFLVLIIVHHLNNCLILGERPINGINDRTSAAGKNWVLTLVKQKQHFLKVYITMVMGVTCI